VGSEMCIRDSSTATETGNCFTHRRQQAETFGLIGRGTETEVGPSSDLEDSSTGPDEGAGTCNSTRPTGSTGSNGNCSGQRQRANSPDP